MQPPDIKPTLLDRAIATVSPARALERFKARSAFELAAFAGGGYTGAKQDRAPFRGWFNRPRDANAALTKQETETLRERSEDLVRNNPLACGIIGNYVSNVVGTGLSCAPQVDRATLGLSEDQAEALQAQLLNEWRVFSESCFFDAACEQNIYEQQAVVLRGALTRGDIFAFVVQSRARNAPYSFAVQLVEADRIQNPDNAPDTDVLIQGIKRDANGVQLGCWVSRYHPGSRFTAAEKQSWQYVPRWNDSGAPNYLHVFDRQRPGQARGVPILAPVIEPLKELGCMTEAELRAAVVTGMFAVFVKMDPEAFSDLFDADSQATYLNKGMGWDGSLGKGGMQPASAINLMPGESAEMASSTRPNANFDPFFQAIVTQIGMAVNLPKEVLLKAYLSSYSAARAAMLDAWRVYRQKRDWLATKYLQPIYEMMVEEAIATGRVNVPGFFDDYRIRKAACTAKWIGDGPGAIDPNKEVEAASSRVDMGLTTLDEEIMAYNGGTFAATNAKRAKEVAARRAANLEPELPAAQPTRTREQEREDASAVANAIAAPIAQLASAALTAQANVKPPIVTVAGATIHVPAPQTTVENHTHVAPTPITVENAVNVPAAQIQNHLHVPEAKAQTVTTKYVRDPDTQEIIQAVATHTPVNTD